MIRNLLVIFVLGLATACSSPQKPPTENPPQEEVPPTPEEPGPMPSFMPPQPEIFSLSNGLTVWHVEQSLPLVTMRLVVPYGASSVPQGKAGLARFVAGLMDEGTTTRSALELSDAVDILGASLAVGASRDVSSVYMEVLSRNLEPALDIFADVVLHPAFDPEELERVRTLWLSGLKQRADEAGQVARLVGTRVFFGDDHPYAHPPRGYESTIEGLTLADVKAFYTTHWIPNNATLIVVGKVERDRLESMLEARFAGWAAAENPPPVVTPEAPPASQPRLVIVNKADAPQTVIRFVFPGPPRKIEDYASLRLFNTLFGGSFTSRLNQNLRERNGYTYGAGSGFSFLRGHGIFIGSSSVRTDVTGPALQEFLKEYGRLLQGDIEADELERARATEKAELVQSYETQGGILAEMAFLAGNQLTPEATLEVIANTENATLEAIQTVARTAAPMAGATLVLVGDKNAILEQLKGITGLPAPTFYTIEGAPAEP